MDKENKNRRAKPARQDWQPHWILLLLQKAWMFVFGAAKIAIGAAATVLIICVVCGLVFAGILGDYLETDIAPNAGYDLDDIIVDQSSTIYYVDSNDDIQVLQEIYATSSSKWVDFEDIPQDLINAAVAIEDKRFFEHQGVDWVTTIKACAGIFFGNGDAGGSTITQQLIKNLTGEDSVTVQRKVMEIFRAIQFEKRYDKDIILEWYLNRIYLGQGCYGVKTAAEAYFGKELQSLTIAECASLISITNNPSMFDPYSDDVYEYEGIETDGAGRNRIRQQWTLGEMESQGLITKEEYNEAMAQEMVFKSGIEDEDRWVICPNESCAFEGIAGTLNVDGEHYYCPTCGTEIEVKIDASEDIYSWFVDTVLEDVAKDLAERDGFEWNDDTREVYMHMIQMGGYSIYSTIDMEIQDAADAVYTDLENIPETRSGQQPQSGMVIVDNRTGYIVAIVGGVGEKEYFDQFNRATDSDLQTGSSIKPLSVYAPAFEAGYSPASVISDMPLNYIDGAYPLNDTRSYSYSKTIYDGLVGSVNAVAANLATYIGVGYSFDFAKEQFGLSGLLEEYDTGSDILSDIGVGPLALGAQTLGLSIRDMTSAFATFPNDGVYREGITYTKVYDRDGNLILDNTQETRDILSSKTIDYINYCLYNAVVSSAGTGGAADFSGAHIYGKTGTTGDDRDRWFCGYTYYYTAAVWFGYDEPEEINLVGSQSNPAARLWRMVMEPIHEDLEAVKMHDPYDMTGVTMCLDSGKIATDACAADVRNSDDFSRTAFSRAYSEDIEWIYCDKHVMVDYCKEGKGVCNEYCKLFAAEAKANAADLHTTIERKSLVRMTQSEIDELIQAERYKLNTNFLRDDYIYLVTNGGNDATFKGIKGNANKDVNAPYLVCTVHTKEAWEKYQEAQQPTEPPTDPNAPTTDPGNPGGGVTEDSGTGAVG